MRYLLDTHVFLWWLENSRELNDSIYKVIKDNENQILVSVVSGLEFAIKQKSGKLSLKTTIKKMFEISGFEILNVNLNHALELDKFPLHKGHNDPFDRMLIAQAKVENLTLITSDPKFWEYKVSLLGA